MGYLWLALEIAVPVCVLLVLGYLTLQFNSGFWHPANRLDGALDRAISRLEEHLKAGQAKTKPLILRQCFDGNGVLEHAWKQYEETLHQPALIDPVTGQTLASEARSTIPSEVFFSTATVVDSQVRAEFFKHLPGISTGIGIIGTFLGLIVGLWQFHITDNPQDATNSLSALLRSVGFAFLGSLCAIGFAMLTTFLEKRRLSELYGKVEHIQMILDETYQAGVGEEYLSRLVAAAEESSSQTRILKDALVSDLKQILTELTDKQIAASNQSTAKLSETIADTLREPLDRIAGGVSKVSEDQSTAVTQLLTDVLAGFSDKLENLFGAQISGIGDMQRRTIEAMESAVGKLHELTNNMETAGTRATDAMGERLNEALQAAEARQQAMATAMNDMLMAFREQTAQSGEATKHQLTSLLETLGERLGAAIGKMEASGAQATETMAGRLHDALAAADERQQAMSAAVNEMLSTLREHSAQSGETTQRQLATLMDTLGERLGAAITSIETTANARADEQRVREERQAYQAEEQFKSLGEHVSKLTTGVERLIQATGAMTDRLDASTGTMVSRLNNGAETLLSAANQFEKSGRAASESYERMAGVSDGLNAAATTVAGAARSLDSVVGDYRAARDSVTSMLATIKQTVEAASRDASLTSDIVIRIESAAQKLATAQKQADSYLDEVTDVLAQSHQRFADGMRKTVGEANTLFHNQLAQATGLLRETIQELDQALPAGSSAGRNR